MKQETNDKIFNISTTMIMAGVVMAVLGTPLAFEYIAPEAGMALFSVSAGAVVLGIIGCIFAAWTNPAAKRA